MMAIPLPNNPRVRRLPVVEFPALFLQLPLLLLGDYGVWNVRAFPAADN